jgi:hypothetical protein
MRRDIKKDKRIRFLMRLLFVLFGFIAPIIVIELKYDLFTEFNGWKLSVVGMITLISLIYRFKNRLLAWLNAWEYSVFKYVLLGFSKIALFVVIVAIAHIAQREASNVVFILDWYLLFNAIAYLVCVPIEEHYDYYIKREIRKQEMREVRDE